MNEEYTNPEMNDTDREILAGHDQEQRFRRGIKLLPNAITTAAMFFGFYALIEAMNGRLDRAVWAVVVAAVCDLLDGRVARLIKGTSAFGQEYDSLSDLISFGLAPAMIAYFWALENAFGALGWAAGFVYLACAAIRLAKFNTLTGEEESRKYFRGIPSPVAAGLIITPIMLHLKYGAQGGLTLENVILQGGMLAWLVLVGLLMVSNLRFRTFKDLNLKRFGPVPPMVAMAALIAVLMARPALALFFASFCYLAIGLIEGGIIIRRRERELRDIIRQTRREQRLQRKLEKKKRKQARKEAKQSSPFRMFK